MTEVVNQLTRFALNADYKKLYDKVVPPLAHVEIVNKETTAKVEQLKLIVA